MGNFSLLSLSKEMKVVILNKVQTPCKNPTNKNQKESLFRKKKISTTTRYEYKLFIVE